MASPFSNAVARIQGSAKALAGESVTYDRNGEAVALTAIPGDTQAEQDDGTALTIQTTVKDWLVDVVDLVLDSVAVEPERGDLIKQTIGSATHTFEVLPFGESAYTFTDRLNTRYRIHTKLIGVE